jgi:hypothetical protein
MSDHHDSDDDLIRDALRAEAAGVTAGDEVLGRIHASTTAGRSSSSRRLAPWLVAAALAIVAGTATIVAGQDGDQSVDLVDDPRTTAPIGVDDVSPTPAESCAASDSGTVLLVFMSAAASDTEIAAMRTRLEAAQGAGTTAIDSVRYVDRAEAFEAVQRRQSRSSPALDSLTLERTPTYFVVTMPAGTDDVGLRGEIADLPGVLGLTSTDCSGGGASSDDPPAQLVAVTERGHIVVVDAATGEVIRDLGGFDDPTDPEAANREGGPYSITGVALHPNGREVYFETCCEPASGVIFKVPVDGSVSIDSSRLVPVAYGFGIDISADGRWLAFVSGPTVSVMDLETGQVPYTAESGDGTHDWVQTAINADGSVLAVERALARDADGRVTQSDARTTTIGTGAYEEHPTQGGRFIPVWMDGGRTLASAPALGTNPLDSNVDASGTWILEVTEDGALVARSEENVRIPGGPYTAADW